MDSTDSAAIATRATVDVRPGRDPLAPDVGAARPRGRSLGVRQALRILAASLAIGLLLAAFQIDGALDQQRERAYQLQRDILDLSEGAAASAAWTLDEHLAGRVADSVAALESVRSVEILDDAGESLAYAAPRRARTALSSDWFESALLRLAGPGERRLRIVTPSGEREVGTFSIALDPGHVGAGFTPVAMSILGAALLQSLLIGAALLAVSSRLVTRPLRSLAGTVGEIDAESVTATALDVPAGHEGDEIGELARHMNQTLGRLADTQKQLQALATRDALTGLPNRALIAETLGAALARARRARDRVAVLCVDVDGFKKVNDSLGHGAGDDLLGRIAARLTAAVRENDAVARLGGDEFLLIVEGLRVEEDVLGVVRTLADSLVKPFEIAGQAVRLSASIGIALFPDNGADAHTLMRQADMAMSDAKHAGGARWGFFAHEMSERADARLRIEAALADAIERGEFALVYQPQVESRNGRLAACEALLRWHRDGEVVAPMEFIPVAESSGLIVDIGDWVIEEACRQIRRWSEAYRPVRISVNVSPRQLDDPRFIGRVTAAVVRHGIEPSLLEIEITETAMMTDIERKVVVLSRLREFGIAVSVDDFGIGYSSLSYLERLPLDVLKIDRAFVSGERASMVIAGMVIGMAKWLGLRTVAEGVETEGQRRALANAGCDLLQGYLISRPVEPERFEREFLASEALDERSALKAFGT